MATGTQIQAARKALGMTQKKLADDVGVTPAAIRKIEAGKTRKSHFTNEIEKVLGLAPVPDIPSDLDKARSELRAVIAMGVEMVDRARQALELISHQPPPPKRRAPKRKG